MNHSAHSNYQGEYEYQGVHEKILTQRIPIRLAEDAHVLSYPRRPVDRHVYRVYRREHEDTKANHCQDRSQKATDDLNLKYMCHDPLLSRNIPQLRLVISIGLDGIRRVIQSELVVLPSAELATEQSSHLQ